MRSIYLILKNNEKAFAAFDVFEVEPAFDSPLLNLKTSLQPLILEA